MCVHRIIAIALFTALCAGIQPANAQWLNYPDSRTPRSKDGKPNLTAPAPRLNGKPDLSGVWEAQPTPHSEVTRALGDNFYDIQIDIPNSSKYFINLLWDLKPSEDPMRPEAAAIFKQRNENRTESPMSRCLPGGIPFFLLIFPFKMIQSSNEIIMLSEHGDPARQIYTDGRPLPKDPEPSWMGYSSGKWQGDTLVVETTGFNGKNWLDAFGHPRSEQMRITERYHRRDFGHMDLEMTFDDSKYYTRPFTVKTGLRLLPDSDVMEYVCAENEQDRAHLGN